MTGAAPHPEREADRRADRLTWAIVLALVLASFVVNATSVHDELLRVDPDAGWAEPWLREGLSHLALLAAAPIVPMALSRAPVGRETWRWAVPAHMGASVVFAALHIALMVGLRKAAYPALLGQAYGFDLGDGYAWLYEYRKDAYTYAVLALGFSANRLAEQRRLEAETRRDDARSGGRLTLRCGGRTLFVDAADVVWAKAASNYVEIRTREKVHLARLTLAELERLLEAAGGRHVRVHRSHIVNLDEVAEIAPNGEGDVTLRLSTGETVPGSRRYRARLSGVSDAARTMA